MNSIFSLDNVRIMNKILEIKKFLVCIIYENVMMRTPILTKKKFINNNKYQFLITLCRTHDSENKLKNRKV